MRCEDTTRDLPRYAEGAMSGWSRLMLRLHIAGCSSCRQHLAALGECGRSLAEALQTPVDAPDMSDSVMAAIGQSLPASRARLDRKWVAVPVAVAGALAAILVAVQHQPVPVTSHQPPRSIVAKATKAPSSTRGHEDSPLTHQVGKAPVRRYERVAIHKWHAPKRTRRVRQPEVDYEKQPEPISTASSKIVVVVRQRIEPIVARIEVEATNLSTGTVVHYDATYDDSGNEQSTYMAFAKDNSDKEGTEL